MVSSGIDGYQTVDRMGVRRSFDPYNGVQQGFVDTASYSSVGTNPLTARKIDFDEFSNSTRRDLQIRQNGANDYQVGGGGYLPPSLQAASRLNPAAVQITPGEFVHDDNGDDVSIESEMPFDMKEADQSRRTPQQTKSAPPEEPTGEHTLPTRTPQNSRDSSFETIWESSPDRESNHVNSSSRRQHGQYRLPPPKFSDPSAAERNELPLHQEERVSLRLGTGRAVYREVNVQPGRTDASPSFESAHIGAKYKLVAELDVLPSHEKGSMGDDSLFDFKEEVKLEHPDNHQKPVKVTHRMRRKSPRDGDIDEPDDTSLEDYGESRKSPTNLQERAQQAWKFRQKKNSALRSKRDLQWPRKQNSVSFQGQDTVQYFDPNDDLASEGKNDSLEERSLNSEYTKTLESEVEDMIKDIFFIGSGTTSRPGRRKFKDNHEVKTRLRTEGDAFSAKSGIYTRKPPHGEMETSMEDEMEGQTEDQTEDQDDDLETNEHDLDDMEKEKSEEMIVHSSQSQLASAGPSLSQQAETTLWGMMEGGMTAVSEALGLSPESEGADLAQRRSPATNNAETSMNPFEACTGGIVGTASSPRAKPQVAGLYDYAQDFLNALEDSNDASSASHSKDSAEVGSAMKKDAAKREGFTEDFSPLALHAAKSLHQTQGVEFDESYEMNLKNDMKLSSAELKLPLGCKLSDWFVRFWRSYLTHSVM